jgi:hypothetical protein
VLLGDVGHPADVPQLGARGEHCTASSSASTATSCSSATTTSSATTRSSPSTGTPRSSAARARRCRRTAAARANPESAR